MFFCRVLLFLIVIFVSLSGSELFAAPSAEPEKWDGRTVSPALQLPQIHEDDLQSVKLPIADGLKTPVAIFDGQRSAVVIHPLDEEANNEGEQLADDLDENEELLPPVDPGAVEEARILAEEEATPPEDEGSTVQVTELQFDFPVVENQKVQYYIDYFTGPGRNAFTRWLERTTRYLPYIQDVFAALGLPRDLAYLSIVESGLNPKAYSSAHASGPWQFIPGTGKIFGLETDYWWDERRDFEKSTLAAALYIRELYELFNGNWYLAVAAYNAGPGAVSRAVERSGMADFWSLAHNSFLPEETKNYIPKLLAVLLIAKQPEKYGFTEIQFLEPIACEKVTVDSPTDLFVIARLSGSSYEEIKELNPELKRWCTPPKIDSYQVNLPVGRKESFLAAYSELPISERSNYKLHRVAKGETLKGLSHQYHISADEILRANFISSSKKIKVGRSLVIPLHAGGDLIPREDLLEDSIVPKIAGVKSYKIKKGDTLSQIARRTGVTVEQLKSWNRLSSKSRLKIGQIIVVGPGKNRVQTIAKKNTDKKSGSNVAKRSKSSAENRIVYTVKRGDTIYKIAREYAVNPAEVMNWNDISSSHTLQPGQSLTLLVHGRKGG